MLQAYYITYPELGNLLQNKIFKHCAHYTGVKAKPNPEPGLFSPGGGLVSGVDTFAGLFGKKIKTHFFE